MIIAEVCLKLATIKGHSKMCSFITQHNGMLTAGMSSRAVARESNVNFSTISRHQRRFREFGSTSNQPASQPQTVFNHTSPGPPHPASSPPWSSETSHRTAAATTGLHNQRISAQTVRNRLREAQLHARHPHRGLNLTAVRRRNWIEWANAHIRWRLALWRGVFFTDES